MFLSSEFTKKFHGEVPYFCTYLNFLEHIVGLVERSLHAKNQLDPSNQFNTTPNCDRHRHRHRRTVGHRAIASVGPTGNRRVYKGFCPLNYISKIPFLPFYSRTDCLSVRADSQTFH